MAKSKKTTVNKTAKYPKTPAGSTWVWPLRELLRLSLRMWRQNFKTLLTITALYGAFYFIFVSNTTRIDTESLQGLVEKFFGSDSGSVGVSLVLTGSIFGLSTTLDQASGTYAMLLFVINSLAFMWVLRHVWAGKKPSFKQAYYQGMYPLIPTLLILMVIFIQLIPLTVGAAIMGQVLTNGLATSLIETIFFVGVFLVTLLLSGYWIIGSIMAFYIVTIPNATPLEALRSAKDLLKKRRLLVLQRVLLFAILSLLAAFVLLFIIVSIVPAFAGITVTILSIFALPWSHVFLFNLYRSLIDE